MRAICNSVFKCHFEIYGQQRPPRLQTVYAGQEYKVRGPSLKNGLILPDLVSISTMFMNFALLGTGLSRIAKDLMQFDHFYLAWVGLTARGTAEEALASGHA
jgi:hypothetical protein